MVVSTRLRRILERCPNLRVVCEHITTAAVANFVEKAGWIVLGVSWAGGKNGSEEATY